MNKRLRTAALMESHILLSFYVLYNSQTQRASTEGGWDPMMRTVKHDDKCI